ncbi:exodeoxyribonuclease VII large subunit [Candidatus Chlamydia sanziniae]|uniref:Exodeoxyribonuclease 7 large subunit n=1 Tax=Candidatus Chlamydia sanziniae TaxID=1806891 RepID=A0A1A9HWB8_9CHLA|nr:exodeoxyribonuclease VII large subunit [Candidatus Chlamydia sanziniae]ANH78216.1 Exodeoxyribonuclease VII large subunit [Candidatus Chlamydia sanziniae]
MSIPTQPVAYLTESIKTLLESHFYHIVVKGELSNVSLQPSGHLYFGIKDSKAFLHGAFFHFKSKYYDRRPKDGDAVIIHGKLSVYAPRGQYQVIAQALVYAGEGDLLQQFEEMKKRLTAEGYFAKEKKKPLPLAPKCIGIITSPTGAVIQDILQILSRRAYNYKILIYPVTVQGDLAAREISRAIEVMNTESLADVLILARGGGSIEDLWAFNEEIVVKAIHASDVPILSAVGHETDYTLCDFAADVRAPTPSAAAEIVCKSSEEHIQILEGCLRHVLSHSRQFLSAKQQQLYPWRRFLERAEFYRTAQQQLDYVELAVNKEMQSKVVYYLQRYEHISRWLQGDLISKTRYRLRDLQKMLSQAFYHKLFSIRAAFSQLRKSCSAPRHPQRYAQQLVLWQQQLHSSLLRHQHYQQQAYAHKQALFRHAQETLKQEVFAHKHTVTLLNKRLAFRVTHIVQNQKQHYANVKESFTLAWQRRNEVYRAWYHALRENLYSLNPKNVLQRGYAMLFDFKDQSAIISVSNLKLDARIRVQLHDGEALLTVIETSSFTSVKS